MGRNACLAIAVSLCWPAPASADIWRCEASTVVVCDRAQCQENKPSVWLMVDFDRKTYSRCDSKSCDQYQMMAVPSGIFVNVVYNPSSIFKATADGSEYIEVATSGLATYSQFGTCRVQ
jgi:hypothetical protein